MNEYLLREKKPPNYGMVLGLQSEERIIRLFEQLYLPMVGKKKTIVHYQRVGLVIKDGWIGCTPDAIAGNYLVEAKTRVWKINPHVQMSHYVQIQVQLYVTGLKKCYYVQYHKDRYTRKETETVKVVAFSPEWVKINIPLLKTFYDELQVRLAEGK